MKNHFLSLIFALYGRLGSCRRCVPVGLSYVIGIPLGYGLVGMWVGFAIDENVRGVILLHRWRSGKWRSKGFVVKRPA